MNQEQIEISKELTKVDYSYNSSYRPSIDSIKFVQFIQEVNNGAEENKTPIFHLKILDLLFDPKPKRKAIMCFRGAAKTSLMEYGVLYGSCFNELFGLKDIHVMMYVGNSIDRGVKDLRRQIEARYHNSPYLQDMIPNQKFKWEATDSSSRFRMPLSDNDLDDIHNAGRNITDTRLEFVNKKKEPFVIRCFGIQSGIRGFKEYGQRPSLCVFDDIIKDLDSTSQSMMEKTEDIVYKAVNFALHPTKKMQIWVGTPFNAKDPLYKAIESGSWAFRLFPICEKFPCTEDEFKGAWEDRFPYETILDEYNTLLSQGKQQSFYQELMLQITPDDDLLVPKGNLIEIEDKVLREQPKSNFNFYITTDFAFTDKEHSDYSVISVFGANSNKDLILIDGFLGKQDMKKNIDTLFSLVQKYRPLEVGIEVTGQQIGFITFIQNEMYSRQIYFRIKEVRPSKDKFSRFNLFSPMFLSKKIHISSRMLKSKYGIELEDELYKTTTNGFKSKHDDILDTFSMLQDLEIIYPMYQNNTKENAIIYKDNIFLSLDEDEDKCNTIF